MINEQGRKSMEAVRHWIRAEMEAAIVQVFNTHIPRSGASLTERQWANQKAEESFARVLALLEEKDE
jgi:hypothetical protein